LSHAAEKIRSIIQEQGAIPFARFMELALYCPVCGYYEKEEDTTGQHGDFYTSVSVGSLFGELLAFQFAEWLQELKPQRAKLEIVEAGAQDGQLAKDILLWLREQRPATFCALEYCIVEPSARRQQSQRRTLAALGSKARWVSGLGELGGTLDSGGMHGIIFSNELLDAMPVHRLAWDAKQKNWFEWGVRVGTDKFVWTRMVQPTSEFEISGFESLRSNAAVQLEQLETQYSKLETKAIARHFSLSPELLAVLPDGFVLEMAPAAERWWHEAARVLKIGKLLTFDYGLTAGEFLVPERSRGTARAYHRHHASDDLLANPGEQDLTAHVNFTAIQNAGEAAGLKTIGLVPQAKFLTQIAERALREQKNFGHWNDARTRQFQTLTHPEHLGRAFRVLVQERTV
jgi:SAM-dependent MidA family methyltransferase